MWCSRGDSAPAELILFRDLSVEEVTGKEWKRGTHQRLSTHHKPKEHNLSPVVAAQKGTEFLVTHQEETIPHTQSKQSSLPSPSDGLQRQNSKHSLPCAGCRSPALPRTTPAGCGRSSTNTGPPSPGLSNQLLHRGWTISLLNELITPLAEADKDHSFLTFALEGMIFIANLSCFCCYGLHSGHEQGGNFPQSHGSVAAPKMNSWYYRLSFTHRSLIGISSF